MAYTPATVDQVKAILPVGHGLSDAQITAAIAAAACVVDRAAESCSSSLSDSCLTQVHIYLSAHYCVPMSPSISIKSEKDACGGSAIYSLNEGTGVNGTWYGQMANTLSGGCLAELDKQPANFFSIGC